MNWQAIEEAFHHAVELEADARAAYLADLRTRDAALHAELVSLLLAEISAEQRLHRAIDGTAAQLLGTRVGKRVGAYELVELIGEGGMGSVYRAVRADAEYTRDVAIKVLRPGAASAQMVARLRDERQILAALDHPGIVRLLDGGSTDDGAPYLVLEYIEGRPITEVARTLGVAARVQLLLRVCDTVQYAHQRFVVHRDIKPSNVLVGDSGEPKLLDFGIAKLLADDAREAHTRSGLVPMTPAYASPEQVRGEPVSTATDVYALGALLFELLVGAPLYEPADNPLETLRVICEVVPPRASSVAPSELRAAIAGDLDNIIAKALHKDPAQRYATVAALASDLRRHLDGEAVLARAPTLAYRAHKLVRRHAGVIALGALVLAVLLASTVWSLREARRADREAARAAHGFAEGRRLAHTLVFEVEEQLRDLKGATAARQQLLDASLAYLDNLTAAAADDPVLARELALAYMKLGSIQGDVYAPSTGQIAAARASYDKAFALLDGMTSERTTPATRAVRTTGELGMGLVYQALGEIPRATQQLRAALVAAADLDVAPAVQLRAYNALAFLPKEPAIAAADLERMSAIAAAWRAREPASLEARYWAVLVREIRGVTSPDPVAAIAELRDLVGELTELSRARPSDARFIRERAVIETTIAGAYGSIGNVQLWLPATGDVAAAIPYARSAVEAVAALVARDPDDIRLRSDHAGLYATLGALLVHSDAAASLAALDRGLATLATLTAAQRAEFYTRQNEWLLHCARAAALAHTGAAFAADAAHGMAMAEDLVSGMRGERMVAMCRFLVADAHAARGEHARAAILLAANVDELAAVVGQPDAPISTLIGLAQSADQLAALQPERACALAQQVATAWRAWPVRGAFIEREQAARDRVCPTRP